MEVPDLKLRLVAWGFHSAALCLFRVVREPSVSAPLPHWTSLAVLSVRVPSHSLSLTALLSSLSRSAASVMNPPFYRLIQ